MSVEYMTLEYSDPFIFLDFHNDVVKDLVFCNEIAKVWPFGQLPIDGKMPLFVNATE